MSLRRAARLISFILLFCLFAEYSRKFLGEDPESILIRTWTITFHKLDAIFIYWIMLRMIGWIVVYLRMLRLESGFTVYLFLRQRSFPAVYVRMYVSCLCMTLLYYGLGTAVMAVYHRAAAPGTDIRWLLCPDRLPAVLAGECLGCLIFCLSAYLIHRLCRKAEIGFLAALIGRLLLGYAVEEVQLGLPFTLAVNLLLAVVVFCLMAHNFGERVGEG